VETRKLHTQVVRARTSSHAVRVWHSIVALYWYSSYTLRYGTEVNLFFLRKPVVPSQYSDSPCSPILYAPREQSAYCAPPRTLVLRTVEFLDESCCVSYPPHLQLCKRCNICATYKYNSGICIYCLWMKIKCNSLCNNGLYFAQMRSSYRETCSTCFYLRRDFYPMIVEDLRKPYSARS